MAVAALLLGAWTAPAAAQIIATSIPKSVSGGGEGRWAFHAMWSPYAKWNINTFQEDPTSFLATKGDPKADLLLAGEVAFKAGDSASIGIGGWYNKIGNHSAEYAFFGVDPDGDVFLSGPINLDVKYTEGHINAFYKSLGVQFGYIHSTSTVNTITADVAEINGEPVPVEFVNPFLTTVEGAQDVANDYDGYLVYKTGGEGGGNTNWSFSLGGGFYHYDIVKKTVPSAFATVTLGLFKGLGVDASYWYVGKTKRTELQDVLDDIGLELDQNLSRWMLGVSYTFGQ